jgi:hypothetical protein
MPLELSGKKNVNFIFFYVNCGKISVLYFGGTLSLAVVLGYADMTL